ncbi:hypothetical protein BJX61DRAFT_518671 [Aspergillus egyptiacus]|nr:hypothetical protein BJX61DRAFT_518671 [Aspergillus egyptiacus]
MDLFTRPSKPNTRIPPILLARRPSSSSSSSSNSSSKSPSQPAHLASLSKRKLALETATPDPDLRRCLGHHRLLRRSIVEAQAAMRRYMDEVLESDSDDDDLDSDSDDDDEDSDDEFGFFDVVPTARARVRSQRSSLPVPVPVPSRGRDRGPVGPPHKKPGLTPPTTRELSRVRCRDNECLCNANANSATVRAKIAGVVKGFVAVKRRFSSPSLVSVSPATATTLNTNMEMEMEMTPVPAGPGKGVQVVAAETKALVRISEKNVSCSDLLGAGMTGQDGNGLEPLPALERTQSYSNLQAQSQSQSQGQKYAQRLGWRRRCATPSAVATVPVTG